MAHGCPQSISFITDSSLSALESWLIVTQRSVCVQVGGFQGSAVGELCGVDAISCIVDGQLRKH